MSLNNDITQKDVLTQNSDKKSEEEGKYIPPHLRNKKVEEKKEEKKESNFNSFNKNNNYNKNKEVKEVKEVSDRWKSFSKETNNSYNNNKYSNKKEYYNKEKESEVFGDIEEDGNIGINFDKYDDIPVETSGEECPEPITSFETSEIPESLFKNIQRAKYKKPTPVQKFSFPIIYNSRDLMACAQTGSGKTCAFLLPIVANLINKGLSKVVDEDIDNDNPFVTKPLYPTCLILSPIRELSIQIYNEARKFAFDTGMVSQVIYGGEDISYQIKRLKSGCDILVATPGRLLDFIEKGKISLKGIKYLVLDEADRMLDMGFEEQIRQIIDEEDMPKKRQTLMFSATFPKEIQQLASDFLKNYIFLRVGKVGSTSNLIKQKIEYVEESEKFQILLGLIKNNLGKTLVFVEKKKNAEELEYYLGKEGIKAESIHGDRTQFERIKALAKFKEGKVDVLVATSVAARGLDIECVTHVINFDMPSNIQEYVHRIGRTARKGHEGKATGFFTDENKNILNDLYDLLYDNDQEIPNWLSSMYTKMNNGYKKTFKSNSSNNKDFRKKTFKNHYVENEKKKTFNSNEYYNNDKSSFSTSNSKEKQNYRW